MASAEQGQENVTTASKDRDAGKSPPEKTTSPRADEADSKKSQGEGESRMTIEAVLPEDVLSDEELKEKEPPKYEDWYEESDTQPDKTVSGDSSVGAVQSVKPFNFGRDPSGPEDKTLYLTVPKLGLQKISVFNGASEEKLKESVVHVPVTGFPWQKGRIRTSPGTVSGIRAQVPPTSSTTSTGWRRGIGLFSMMPRIRSTRTA